MEISISSIGLNEEELLEELLDNSEDINQKNDEKNGCKINNNINKNGKDLEKIIPNKIYNIFSDKNNIINKEKQLLNIKRKLLEIKEKNILNNNNSKNNNYTITEDEKTIYELIKNYSFDKVFKKSLQNNLDINNNLDRTIINLIKKVGYKQLYKMLFTIYGIYNSSQSIASHFLNIKEEEEIKQNLLQNEEKVIIKNMDIKSNKYRQTLKNNITKNNKGLGLHLHKNKYGVIYKYLLHRMDNNKGWFYCSDRNCKGVGILSLKNKKFQITRDHTLRYQDHNFYTRILPNEINLFKDFKNLPKNDVQIIYKCDGGVYAVFY